MYPKVIIDSDSEVTSP